MISNTVTGANITVSNGLAGGWASGGGIASTRGATAIISNTLISNNSVGGGGVTLGRAFGGGVFFNESTPMSINGSEISGNSSADQAGYGYGGGIVNGILPTGSNRMLTITDSTIAGNSGFYGGAIVNSYKVNLLRCTISGNTSTASSQ